MLACRLRIRAAVVAALSLVSVEASAEDTWTDPFPGVRHLHRVTSNQNINVLRVDLCASGVSFRATKATERGKTVSSFAEAVGAQAAVNGDFFKGDFSLERGIAVGDGVPWPASATPEDESVGQLAFGDGRVELIEDAVLQKVEPWMKNVVGGRPTLLVDGKVGDFSGHPNLCLKNPRTAVGLSQRKKLLLVAVVDGRHEKRAGMTCTELAEFMRDLGADEAMAFDGGGSSTMWLDGEGVLNYPTDGKERLVSNHLAIFAKGQGMPAACERPPTGKFEVACESGLSGWVKEAAEPVELDVTFDASPGTLNALVRPVSAMTSRSETCDDAGACGLGFHVALPPELVDGRAHQAALSFRGRPADVVGTTSFTCAAPSAPSEAGKEPPRDTPRARPSAVDDEGCHASPGHGGLPSVALATAVAVVVLRRRRKPCA